MAPPLLGRFGAKCKSPQTSPIDSHVKSIFFTKQSSQCILYGFREGSPLHAVSYIMDVKAYKYVIQLRQRHILSRWLLFSATTRFALRQKLLFNQRTNEDKLTTKQLGLPRPNVSIEQVYTKGGESYIQELERKKKWANLMWSHIMFASEGSWMQFSSIAFHL